MLKFRLNEECLDEYGVAIKVEEFWLKKSVISPVSHGVNYFLTGEADCPELKEFFGEGEFKENILVEVQGY